MQTSTVIDYVCVCLYLYVYVMCVRMRFISSRYRTMNSMLLGLGHSERLLHTYPKCWTSLAYSGIR